MRLRSIGGCLCVCAICLALSGSYPAVAQSEPGILGARRYLQFCAACHGSDGRGGDKAASLATSETIRTHSDDELFRIIHDGTPEGMPPFAQIGETNIRTLVHFLRVLQNGSAPEQRPAPAATTGNPRNPEAGRTLFFGKAQCAACHRIQGQGAYIASDLTAYGRTREADAILRAIVAPSRLTTARVVTVTTRKGQVLTGVVKNEDNFTIDLQTQDGAYDLLDRNELARVIDSGTSLMPRDYGQLLSPSELNNIAEFLHQVAAATQEIGPEQP